MGNSVVLHLTLLVFSFLASVIQGITGFGDAILLQVLWFTATEVAPHIFNTTALGESPVKAVTLLMYCRIIFLTPVLSYLSLRDGIFSLQMTLGMAIPSTLTALAGMFIFKGSSGNKLKIILGASSLVFAALYVVILIAKYVLRRRKLQQLSGEAREAPAAVGRATAVTILPESAAVQVVANARAESMPDLAADPGDAASPTLVSTTTGSPFTRREAVPRAITEVGTQGQPALTPSKVSPTCTLVYTRVRINRNLTEDGKIKMSTKVGAAVASAVSGVMGSLTGVGAPPQIIFILLFDVPAYIMRLNFSLQFIPSAALRFVFAWSTNQFSSEMVPLFFTSLVGGYGGLVVGVMLGKVLGPKSYNVFVLTLLLLSSLIMFTPPVSVLVVCTALCTAVTVAAAFYEHRMLAAKLAEQHALERDLEARRAKAGVAACSDVQAVLRAPPRRFTSPQAAAARQRCGDGSEVDAGGSMRSWQSDEALSDRASTATFDSSGRSSSRLRRADLMRPPPLWNDQGEPVKPPPLESRKEVGAVPPPASSQPPAAAAAAGARVPSHMVRVPRAAELRPPTTAAERPQTAEAHADSHGTPAITPPSSGPHGMCAEVKRWVEAQEEELMSTPERHVH